MNKQFFFLKTEKFPKTVQGLGNVMAQQSEGDTKERSWHAALEQLEAGARPRRWEKRPTLGTQGLI